MASLPSPPLEDHRPHSRKTPKTSSKSLSRTSKRTTSLHEQSPVVMDGRHKRVWKACERCRMKKTKCDGESPCKRCKDDGLVCTAGSRKKTEFKQLPRGYAEVLENTQYALIATVHKLYTMVRNNESWELGDPEMNDRGQPVIHDIASKLGCIRPSPDLPYAFPEGADDFAELQAQLQQARSDIAAEDKGSRKQSGSSISSPSLDRTDRASSSESDHSNLSKDYNQDLWNKKQAASKNLPPVDTSIYKPTPFLVTKRPVLDDESYSGRTSFDTNTSMPSPVYTEFQTESPMFPYTPFSSWAGSDEFLTPTHSLDLTAHYMKQQHLNGTLPPRSSPLTMQVNDQMGFSDGTIRPGMLECYDIDPMDAMMYDCEPQMGVA